MASYLFPAGGQRGTTVKVRAGGLFLHKNCSFELLGPGVAEAFQHMKAVKQPLWSVVKEKHEVEQALAGKAHIASCLLNYCRAERRLRAA